MTLPAHPLSRPQVDDARNAFVRLTRLARTLPKTSGVAGVGIQLFEQMRTGQLDRARLAPEYSAQLTEDAVQGMSEHLQHYEFGASPKGAEVILTRSAGAQIFHVVRLHFPRGDATSLMFALNTDGKITGISLLGTAGD